MWVALASINAKGICHDARCHAMVETKKKGNRAIHKRMGLELLYSEIRENPLDDDVKK